jgi:hypothetical protein
MLAMKAGIAQSARIFSGIKSRCDLARAELN